MSIPVLNNAALLGISKARYNRRLHHGNFSELGLFAFKKADGTVDGNGLLGEVFLDQLPEVIRNKYTQTQYLVHLKKDKHLTKDEKILVRQIVANLPEKKPNENCHPHPWWEPGGYTREAFGIVDKNPEKYNDVELLFEMVEDLQSRHSTRYDLIETVSKQQRELESLQKLVCETKKPVNSLIIPYNILLTIIITVCITLLCVWGPSNAYLTSNTLGYHEEL